MSAKPFYTIHPPEFRKADIVDFFDHRGNRREGNIRSVETHYRHTGEAFHIYAIHPHGGYTNQIHVGEPDIKALVRRPADEIAARREAKP